MSKILVEVYLPVLHQSFDVYIPLTMQLHSVEPLLLKAIQEVTNGYYDYAQQAVICDRDTGEILDINQTALELSLQNGSRLMII